MFKCLRSRDFEDCKPDQVARVRQFQWDIESKMKSLADNHGNGVFIHSCPSHINAIDDVQWNHIRINGLSMQQKVSDWWHSDGYQPNWKYTTYDCHLSKK